MRFLVRPHLLVLALLACCSYASASKIICVTPTGTDSDDGASWATAKRTIGSAMTVASAGDEIWVAAAVYSGPVSLKPGVGLYGGFAGNEATRSGRNPWANQTILRVEDSWLTVVTVQDGSVPGTVLEGFGIEHVGGQGDGVSGQLGSMLIRANRFANNASGVNALFGQPGLDLRVSGNIFSNNQTGVKGSRWSGVNVVNNTFVGNATAVAVAGSTSLVIGNIVVGSLMPASVGISASASTTIRNNCVYNCRTLYEGVPDQTGYNGNISVDPKLVSTIAPNPHLRDGSPCIDAGNDADVAIYEGDMDGQTRTQGAHVDIGADEYGEPTGGVIRVSPAGSDANDGSSWATAKRTIGAAIEAAGTAGELWIAAGTYEENLVIDGGAIYGGFAGNETSRGQRDWRRNRTIVKGQPSVTKAAVWFTSNATSGALVDGVVVVSIREGVVCDSNCRATVRNCAVTAAGYGVMCYYANDVAIQDSSIGPSGSTAVNLNNCGTATILRNTINGGTTYGVNGNVTGAGTTTIAGNFVVGGSAGISLVSAGPVRVSNNTAVGCPAGTAIRVNSGSAKTVVNNIACFSRYGLNITGAGASDVKNNCVYGNTTANYYQMSDLTGLYGNISVDPELEGGSTTPRLHIQTGSPCRDAGSDAEASLSTTDLDSQARVEGAHIDMGADESNGESWSNGPIWFVSQTGSDSNPGTSWSRPLATLQAAIAKGSGEVWVAAGTYGTTIQLANGTKLYGGFAGWEASVSQRNYRVNETIISYTVTTGTGVSDARVDGFTLQGPTGVDCRNSTIVIANNLFYNKNGSTDTGVGCTDCPNVEIKGNVFTGGRYYGVYARNSTVSMVGNTLDGAQGSTGVSVADSTSNCTLTNNVIVRFASYGALNAGGATMVFRHNCVFGNSAANYSNVTDPTGTNGNISVDPWLDGDGIHLLPGSPCIDAGLDSVLSGAMDCDSQPRMRGAHVDIGADECYGEQWQSAVVTHVSSTGNDSNLGDSWATAKRTIGAAINTRGGEIWVAAGTYAENVRPKTGVSLYGGFTGNETSRVQRDWRRNRTVLTYTAQSQPIVYWDGYARPGTCLDGFVIKGKKPASWPAVNACPASMRMANNLVTGHGHNGIQCSGGSPVIVNNTVIANAKCGMYCVGVVSPTIVGNIIACNGDGGAFVSSSDSGCGVLANNLVSRNSRASGSSGSGIFAQGNVSVYNNTVVCNTAASDTGAIAISAGQLRVENNIVAFNSAGITGSPAVCTNNCIYGNGGLPSVPSGNLAADPLLSGEAYGNLHIQPGSPCIDAGDDSVVSPSWLDCDGQARTQGSHVDIGADEFDGGSWLAAPSVVRVATDGSDTNDGSSWSSPMLTVQAAMDRAGPLGGEVWVKEGTYTGCVSVWPSTWLYGGFAGTESARGQRNWIENPSILDGGAAGSVVSFYNSGCKCGVDGFTLTNGSGTVLYQMNNTLCGGGVLCCQASPTISNNQITQNTLAIPGRGGGVLAYYGSPVIRGNIISRNTAHMGAGVHCYFSTPTITGNTIVGNTCASADTPCGLAFHYTPCSPLTSVTNNIVAFNGSGIYQSSATPEAFRNNCVYGNSSYDYSPTGSAGQGDVQANPMFVNADADDYHLQPASPCIDMGWNSAPSLPGLDFDLARRMQGGGVDIGAYEFLSIASTIRDARRFVDGGAVDIPDAVVSAAFDGFFYLESESRSCGIRVEKAGHRVVEGDRVHVAGTMATNMHGERYVAASTVSKVGEGAARPIYMTYKWLGGSDWLFDAVTGAGQRGAGLRYGINTVGLLVTLEGKVRSSSTGSMVLLDVSNYEIAVIGVPGITWPADGSTVAITGICSLDTGSPVILLREQADVVVY